MRNDIYIIIGTAYLECDEEKVKSEYLKQSVSVSNTVYERKLFAGFKENGAHVIFLSSPALGYYPTSLKKSKIKGLTSTEDFYSVSYNAFLGIAASSKKKALIKQLNIVLKSIDKNTKVHIIVCEAHKPYLDVVEYAKKKKLINDATLLVPDLPEHNIRSKNPIYRFLKRRNVSQIYKQIEKYVDRFVFFAEPMVEHFASQGKQYIVSEGLSSGLKQSIFADNLDLKKHIVFIGKMDERNGIKLIYEVAKNINDDSVVFDLYGVAGTNLDAFEQGCLGNVINHGFIKPSDVKKVLEKASILLSPRFSEQEYTKYSFPSKMFDYIESFKPIITFKLESYPKQLDSIVYYPKSETAESLLETIRYVLDNDPLKTDRETNYSKFISKYDKKNVAAEIISLIAKN